jgi:hypothetical protein
LTKASRSTSMEHRPAGGPPPGAEGAAGALSLFLFLFCVAVVVVCCLLREDFLPPPTGGLSAASYWGTFCCLLLEDFLPPDASYLSPTGGLAQFCSLPPPTRGLPSRVRPSYWRSFAVFTAATYWRTALPGTAILLEVFRSFHCRPLLEDCPPGYHRVRPSYWRSFAVFTAAAYWRTALPGTAILLEVFLLPPTGGLSAGHLSTAHNERTLATLPSHWSQRRWRRSGVGPG